MKILAAGLAIGFVGLVIVSATAMRDADRRSTSLAAQSSIAQIQSGPIEYFEWGEGPTVLVVHGAGGGFDQGRLLAETLGGKGFRWLSVSRFGYLRSGFPDDASTEAQARAFAELLNALEIEKISILAMSGGGPPALKFAELYPERTRKVALLSSAPFTPFEPIIETRPMPDILYTALFGNDVVYWMLSRVARKQLESAFDARPEFMSMSPVESDFVNELIDGMLPVSNRVEGLKNEASAVSKTASYDIETIKAPLLIMHARDDRINPVEISERISLEAPQSEFVAFEQGGHLLLTHHIEVRARIGAFLAD